MPRALKLIGTLAALGTGAVGVAGAAFVGWVSWNTPTKADYSHVTTPPIAASSDPEVIARGRYVVRAQAHCDACHGTIAGSKDDPSAKFAALKAGDVPLSGGPDMVMPFGVFRPINLTPDVETGIGSWSDPELARGIRHAVDKDGKLAALMSIIAVPMADDDLVAVVSYLRSLPPIRREVAPSEPNFIGHAFAVVGGMGPRHDEIPDYAPPSETPTVARGAYLAQGPAGCMECHTIADPMDGFRLSGPRFGGSAPEPSPTDPEFELVAPNLTSHPTGRTGQMSEDAFAARLGAGRAFQDSNMPWEAFGKLSEADRRSIYRFLKTVDPVDNDVGPTRRPI